MASFETAASTNDEYLVSSLITCIHDPIVLQTTLSITRSKRSNKILSIINDFVSAQGLFIVPFLYSFVPVHEETFAMQYVRHHQVSDLKELLSEDTFMSLSHCTYNR